MKGSPNVRRLREFQDGTGYYAPKPRRVKDLVRPHHYQLDQIYAAVGLRVRGRTALERATDDVVILWALGGLPAGRAIRVASVVRRVNRGRLALAVAELGLNEETYTEWRALLEACRR